MNALQRPLLDIRSSNPLYMCNTNDGSVTEDDANQFSIAEGMVISVELTEALLKKALNEQKNGMVILQLHVPFNKKSNIKREPEENECGEPQMNFGEEIKSEKLDELKQEEGEPEENQRSELPRESISEDIFSNMSQQEVDAFIDRIISGEVIMHVPPFRHPQDTPGDQTAYVFRTL